MPGFDLGGLLHGFNTVAAKGRADAAARAEKQADREMTLLHQIATTSDDPEIADLAASALVESVMGGKRPKGGYFERLLGSGPEAVNPVVGTIMARLREGSGGGAAPAPSGRGTGGTPSAPAVSAPPPVPSGSMAQPSTSLTQGGPVGPAAKQPSLTPPPTVPGPMGSQVRMPQMGSTQAPPQVNTPPDAQAATQATQSPTGPLMPPPAAPVPPPPTVMESLTDRAQLRHIWATPSQRQRMTNQLHAEGIELDLRTKFDATRRLALSAGSTEDQARRAGLQAIGVTGTQGAPQEGNVIPDKTSPTGYSQQIWQLQDGTPQIVGHIPAPAPKAPNPANRQAKEFARKAAPTVAIQGTFDPDTGKYYEGETEVTDPIPYQKPDKVSKLTQGQELDAIAKLTKQWEGSTKPLRDVQRQMAIMEAGMAQAKQGNLAQAGQQLLVTFQKILDAESVVRTEEYLRSAQGLSLQARINGYIERLQKGGAGVPVEELEKFAQAARDIVASQEGDKYLQGTRRRITDTAEEFGLNPKLIFYDDTTGATVRMRAPTGEEADVPLKDVDHYKAKGATIVPPKKKSGGE